MARLKPNGMRYFCRDLLNELLEATREWLAAPETRPGVDMAMVGNLTHHAIDNELVIAEFGACHRRERVDHEGALGISRGRAMLSEHRHWRITRVAIENGKYHGMGEAGVMLGVLPQFTEFAFVHGSRLTGWRFAQQESFAQATTRSL